MLFENWSQLSEIHFYKWYVSKVEYLDSIPFLKKSRWINTCIEKSVQWRVRSFFLQADELANVIKILFMLSCFW